MYQGNPFFDAVVGGQLAVGLPVALLAGLISFLSPCVLPLVPGYLGYVGGLTTGATEARAKRRDRRRLVLGVVLFVLGFSVVFVGTSLAFASAGFWLIQWRDLIVRLMGLVVIALGLVFVGQFTFLQRTVKPGFVPATGLAGAPLLGVVFGLGWTPCLGPTLSAVNSLAFTEATAARGAFLGVAYCLGLGVPFVLVALGARWAVGATTFLRRHAAAVSRFGGAVLIVVGLLLLTGAWTEMMIWFRSWIASTGFGEGLL